MDLMPKSNKTDQERVDAVLNTPFFMTSLNDTEDPTIEALQNLQYDGSPQEIAQNFKSNGNSCFKQGKYKDAIEFYSKAIAQPLLDNNFASILYSNRAAVNLILDILNFI